MDKKHWNKQFFGATTLGEKGQVVIPAEARKAMRIGKADKLLVFGMGGDMLVMCKFSNLEKIASHLAGKLKAIKGIMDKSK